MTVFCVFSLGIFLRPTICVCSSGTQTGSGGQFLCLLHRGQDALSFLLILLRYPFRGMCSSRSYVTRLAKLWDVLALLMEWRNREKGVLLSVLEIVWPLFEFLQSFVHFCFIAVLLFLRMAEGLVCSDRLRSFGRASLSDVSPLATLLSSLSASLLPGIPS